jgi:hypothetical protein
VSGSQSPASVEFLQMTPDHQFITHDNCFYFRQPPLLFATHHASISPFADSRAVRFIPRDVFLHDKLTAAAHRLLRCDVPRLRPPEQPRLSMGRVTASETCPTTCVAISCNECRFAHVSRFAGRAISSAISKTLVSFTVKFADPAKTETETVRFAYAQSHGKLSQNEVELRVFARQLSET